jgi:hypothetical protein
MLRNQPKIRIGHALCRLPASSHWSKAQGKRAKMHTESRIRHASVEDRPADTEIFEDLQRARLNPFPREPRKGSAAASIRRKPMERRASSIPRVKPVGQRR